MSGWIAIGAVVAGLFAVTTWFLGWRANKSIRADDAAQREVDRQANDAQRRFDLAREDELRRETFEQANTARWQSIRFELYGKCAEVANEIAHLGRQANSVVLGGVPVDPTLSADELPALLNDAQRRLNGLGGQLAITAGDPTAIGHALLEVKRGAANLAAQLPNVSHPGTVAGALHNCERCVTASAALLAAMRADLGLPD